MIRAATLALLSSLALSLALAGCGQKGPLKLPGAPVPQVPPPAPATPPSSP
jgi:predicted small lipoprotein YifL